MTSVEAPVLCLQKQPDQTRTPRRCPESQARTTENKHSTKLYQTGVAHVDHKTAFHPENAAALKFFPNSASRSGQKLRINRNTEVEGFTYVILQKYILEAYKTGKAVWKCLEYLDSTRQKNRVWVSPCSKNMDSF